jgi:hypothetical protein
MQNENLMAVMEFHGKSIAFQEIEGRMMVNATQMAKPFGKRTRDWLITQQAKDLLTAMTEAGNLASTDLQLVKKGGKNQGTWFHEDLALLFAQWLSPQFYIACNAKLKELLTQQALQLPQKQGVAPIIHNGQPLYAYLEVIKTLGGGTKASAHKRKKRHPEHFFLVYGRNFITEAYFNFLKGYYDYKNGKLQLKLGL